MDDCADETRREEPGAEWAGCVLAYGRQEPESGSDRRGRVAKLPADLFGYGVCSVRHGEPGGLRCIRGGAESMGAHMADGRGSRPRHQAGRVRTAEAGR